MRKALTFSFLTHLAFFSLMIWSEELSIQRKKLINPQLSPVGVVYTELLYKPTNTAMKKGDEKSDLPPPIVKTEKKEDPPSKMTAQKVSPKKQSKVEKTKNAAKSLLDKLRQEEGKEMPKPPKDDNFPTHKQGEDKARGTGGISRRQASPAQMALQSAIKRHFEMPRAAEYRRLHPDTKGWHSVSVLAVGNTLQVRNLTLVQPSGFSILDRSCEQAIREALRQETFALDVISELSGKSHDIECRF